MDNIPEELLFFGDISDDYLWLRSEQCCKSISFSRKLLNNMAKKYNINPDNYKNKRVLLEAIINYWDTIFRGNPEFHRYYEELFGATIILR